LYVIQFVDDKVPAPPPLVPDVPVGLLPPPVTAVKVKHTSVPIDNEAEGPPER